MPKIPRDISGDELSKLLSRYGYEVVRQTGSHSRLVSKYQDTADILGQDTTQAIDKQTLLI